MNNPTISVFTVVPQNPIEREDTVIEGVKAAMAFADEIICFHCNPTDGTLEKLKELNDKRIKIISGGDWNLDRFVIGRKKNAALQHCTKDWCLLMDADEVFECRNILLLKEMLGKNINAYQLRYLHFFSSPGIIKTAESGFYQWKPSLFRNYAGNFIGGLGIMSNTELDNCGRPLTEMSTKIPESIFRVFHYGHCKTNTVAWGKKINQLEATYMEDGSGQVNPNTFKFNSADKTEEFKGQHPEVMKERIDRFKNLT